MTYYSPGQLSGPVLSIISFLSPPSNSLNVAKFYNHTSSRFWTSIIAVKSNNNRWALKGHSANCLFTNTTYKRYTATSGVPSNFEPPKPSPLGTPLTATYIKLPTLAYLCVLWQCLDSSTCRQLEGCLTVHLPHEIKWNANLMQLGNFNDVFLARHVSGTYDHHQEH